MSNQGTGIMGYQGKGGPTPMECFDLLPAELREVIRNAGIMCSAQAFYAEFQKPEGLRHPNCRSIEVIKRVIAERSRDIHERAFPGIGLNSG